MFRREVRKPCTRNSCANCGIATGPMVIGVAAKRTAMKIVVAITLLAGSLRAQDIRVLPVSGNIYVLVGGGANIVASVGKDGVLLVDTGITSMSDKIIAKVQELSRHVTAS